MIIDGYVVPDGTEIEELKTKQGHVFYACNGSVALSKEMALRYVASGKVCECGAHTLTSWSDLCLKCQHKLQHEKYLRIPCVPYHGQPVFVGDDYTEDLEQCLDDQLNDFTLDERHERLPRGLSGRGYDRLHRVRPRHQRPHQGCRRSPRLHLWEKQG